MALATSLDDLKIGTRAYIDSVDWVTVLEPTDWHDDGRLALLHDLLA